MSRRAKYSPEEKIKIVKEYLSGQLSDRFLKNVFATGRCYIPVLPE